MSIYGNNQTIQEMYQVQYQTEVIELLARNKGTDLVNRCATQNCKGNEKTVFNRVGAVMINSTGDFTKGNFVRANGTSVDLAENMDYTLDTVEVAPEPIYAGNNIHENQFKQTMINLKDIVVKGQIDALNLERDKKIVKAIAKGISANSADLLIPASNYYGDKTAELTLKSFVEAMEIARLMLGTGQRLTVIADKKAVADLKTAEGFTMLSEDFKQYFGTQSVGGNSTATGSVITWRHDILDECLSASNGGALTDTDTVGRMFVMVEGVVGIATWGDQVTGRIDYLSQYSKYLLKSSMSVGASILDAGGIFVIEYKKPVTGTP